MEMGTGPTGSRLAPGGGGGGAGVARALGGGGGPPRADVQEDEDELLAAKAVDAVVLAHRVAQHRGHLLQRDVADLMAVIVVEALEVVDVRHGDDGATALLEEEREGADEG